MPQFNSANYPTVEPAALDLLLINQKSTGLVKTVTVESVVNPDTIRMDIVENIEDLRAIDVSELAEGKQALASGYYTFSDGGGGLFSYDPDSSATDNGGTVIQPNSGNGRWIRSTPGPISIKAFGAKGDGTTDDYAALKAAISTGGNLSIPAAVFKVVVPGSESGITVPAGTSLVGQGHNSIIQYYDSGQFVSLFNTNGSNIDFRWFFIRNNATTGISVGFTVNTGISVTWDGVGIDGRYGGAGAQMQVITLSTQANTSLCSLRNCSFYQHNYGLFTANTYAGISSQWKVVNCFFRNSYSDDLEFNAPPISSGGGGGQWSEIVVEGCSFYSNQYVGVAGGFGVGLSGTVLGAVVNGNNFYSYTQDAVHLENGVNGAIISDNTFRLCPIGIRVGGTNNDTRNIVIDSNFLQGQLTPKTGIPGSTCGIQLVDAGGLNYPLQCTVSNNLVENYDYGMIVGNSAMTSDIHDNYFDYSCCGYNGIPSPKTYNNVARQCTYAIQTAANSGVIGKFTRHNCVNLFYSSTGKVTFLGLDVFANGVDIANAATANIPMFPTPAKMYGDSTVAGLADNGNNITSVSLLSYTPSTLTETSRYIVSVGSIGDGSQSIVTGNVCYNVLNSTGSLRTMAINYSFKGAVTFN